MCNFRMQIEFESDMSMHTTADGADGDKTVP